VSSREGEPIATAAAAKTTRKVRLRFADGTIPAKIVEP
jgi:hypothetical protein